MLLNQESHVFSPNPLSLGRLTCSRRCQMLKISWHCIHPFHLIQMLSFFSEEHSIILSKTFFKWKYSTQLNRETIFQLYFGYWILFNIEVKLMEELWHNLNYWKWVLQLLFKYFCKYIIVSIRSLLIVTIMRHLNLLCIYSFSYKIRIILVSTSWNNCKD